MLWGPYISGICQLHCRMGVCPNVDMPNLVTCLDQTPISEWYVVCCGLKNGYQNTCALKRSNC